MLRVRVEALGPHPLADVAVGQEHALAVTQQVRSMCAYVWIHGAYVWIHGSYVWIQQAISASVITGSCPGACCLLG
jgi:hypothetical protein